MNRKYFSLEKTDSTATLTIYGDITSYPWSESDVTADDLSKQLNAIGNVDQIDVRINSYGGEVKEGLAIYNALKRHKAKVRTICDGFACSIASVIFMAGDERVMNESSLLMIHNAWTFAEGNAEELRKQADDLEKITQASIEAYKAHSSLSEDEIKALMDAETWILPEEAVEYGFATGIVKAEKQAASQNAFMKLFEIIKAYQAEEPEDEEPEVAPEDDEITEEPEVEEPETEEPETEEPETEEEPESAEEPETEEPDAEEEPTDEDSEEDSEIPEDEDEGEETPETEEEPAQKWRGFFNAILNI